MRLVMGRILIGGCAATALVGCGSEVSLGGSATPDAAAGASSGGPSSSGSSGGAATGGMDAAGLGPAEGGLSALNGGDGGIAVASAMQQCTLLTTTLCTAGTQCVPGTNEGNCESQLNLEFGCAWATGGDFSGCFQNGQSLGCDNLYPDAGLTLPLTCVPAITPIPLSDAQTKCYALVDALCAQSIQCLGIAPTSDVVQNCEDDVTTDLQNGLPCLLAGAVGAGYAQCVAAIPSLSCGDAGTSGDAGTEAGGAGSAMSITTIPSCADAITFTP